MDHTPNRRNPRLLHFDYSKNGAYFITICTQDRLMLLSEISPDPAVGTNLTDCGRIVEAQLAETERHYPALHIENYVIMPNHIHLLLLLIRENDQPSPQLPEIIRRFKSLCSREWNKASGASGPRLFQPSFYDHIIRNDRDHEEIWKYIQNNPAKWREARSAGIDPPI